MLNVAYKLTLGNITCQSGKGSRLVALDVRAALDVPVNAARVTLDGLAELTLRPGDPVGIALGYDKTATKVFTGSVTTLEQGLQNVTVYAASAFGALTASRFNLLFEKQSAGTMAGDLLGRCKVKKASVENGEKFATFTVSDRESAWEVLAGLARRCGFDFYADIDDKAHFKKYAAGQTHSLEYGTHILDFYHGAVPAALDGVEVYGESPVGQGQGEDASAWLRKKEVKGSAGKSSGNVLRLTDPAARTQDLARTLAKNILAAHQSTARGWMRLLGNPAIRLGDAVKVAGLPQSSQNGTYKVTGVRHRLCVRSGFITEVGWIKV
ncbi:MAG: phage late control D family protein [Chloroflexota bacterium]